MKIFPIIAFICLNGFVLQAQYQSPPGEVKNTGPVPFATTIQVSDLRNHLMELASDEYEGRETGTEGQKKAAEYIADYFKNLGLPPVGDNNSYFQEIAFHSEKWEDLRLQAGEQKYKSMYDFYALPYTNSGTFEITTDEVIFLGYGIDEPVYSDYENIDVKNKVVLVYPGEPVNKNGISHITGTKAKSEWSESSGKKIEAAKKHGAAAILLVDPNIQKNIQENRNRILGRGMSIENLAGDFIPNIFISPTVAKQIIGKYDKKVIRARKRMEKRGKSKGIILHSNIHILLAKEKGSVEGENVIGYIEGTDSILKNEYVIITAHYDHLGKKGESIFNGADDNASGTSTVMEIAEAFASAKKEGSGPKRSVVCMLVSGEEKGLLGSKYYVENPVFPLEQTVVNVNVDMVGRVDKAHENNPDYIYVIGADRLSSELHEINEQANATYTGLELDYTYNAANDPNRYYYRSDHYNFAERGIPAIFYFNGTHEDYHRPTDTSEKIDFEKMEKIGHLVFYTAWELANRPQRIKVDKVKPKP